jgi:hypothetical protein
VAKAFFFSRVSLAVACWGFVAPRSRCGKERGFGDDDGAFGIWGIAIPPLITMDLMVPFCFFFFFALRKTLNALLKTLTKSLSNFYLVKERYRQPAQPTNQSR